MTDSNRTLLGYVKESTFGTTPGSPALQVVRCTGDTLKPQNTYVTSQEIVPTRDIADRIRTRVAAGGGVNTEFMFGRSQASAPYGFPDDWLQWALQSVDWTNQDTTANGSGYTTSFVASTGSTYAQLTRSTGTWPATFTPGRWLRVMSGAANAGNNAHCKVVSGAGTNTLNVMVANTIGDFVAEATVANVVIKLGGEIVNGTLLNTMSAVGKYKSLATADSRTYKGMGVNGFSLQTSIGAIVTASWAMMGQSETKGEPASNTEVAATTAKPFNTVTDHVALHSYELSSLGLGQPWPTVRIRDFALGVDNGLYGFEDQGVEGYSALGSGSFEVTGSLTSYYRSGQAGSPFARFVDDQEFNLAYILMKDGKSYVIEVTRAKFIDGDRAPRQRNSPVYASLQWGAARNPTDTVGVPYTMRITRIF